MSEQLCILAATESDARVIAEHRDHGTEFSEADLAAYEEWVRQQISAQIYAGYVALCKARLFRVLLGDA